MRQQEPRHKSQTDIDTRLEIVREVHGRLPFNQFLGLKVEHLRTDSAAYSFSMKDVLIGNSTRRMLHGGVISAVLDAIGGIAATASAMERLHDADREEIVRRIARMGTIDMRVDYLRPGSGERFLATATMLRTGSKVAVARMELKNEEGLLIAVGMGAFLIG
jgi:uncharacterized protein (TIGR00369 family)